MSEHAAALPGLFPGAIIRPWRGVWPRIAPDAFVAPGAVVVGDVEIGPEASVWYGCVLRGDDQAIRVGPGSNVQDGTVVHVTLDAHPTVIGRDVTVGHGARLHGCTVGDGCLVGIGAVVLDGAAMEGGSMLAAGSVLTPRKRVPGGELWAGSPARPMRALTEADRRFLVFDAEHYRARAREYREAEAARG
jgi:carbonic anhydrase/acetyltransferase-like protein (isoleucine patch superfamily)